MKTKRHEFKWGKFYLWPRKNSLWIMTQIKKYKILSEKLLLK